MAGENTLTSLNTQFKYIQDKAMSLLPENAVFMKLVPEITEATKQGRNYLVPTQLSHENGVTFGDGTVFALNSASAAVYDEIDIVSSPIILLTQISESVANRMANSKQSFITEASLRAKVMYDSLARYLEISMLYGKSATGIGVSESVTYAGGAATTATVVITAAQWSSGVWGGAPGMVLDVYHSGSTKVTANGAFTVTGITVATRTIAISGNATDLATLKSNETICYFLPKGAYANDMVGIDSQVTGGVAYFGIDPTVYPLWQGQTYACGSASLTMGKVLAGNALAVGVGGLNSRSVLMVSAKTYGNLNSDQAALRMYDSSYSKKDAENGSEGIKYLGASGEIEVIVNNIVKEGEAFMLPVQHLKRVGAKELSFQRPGKKDEFFQEIPGYAGYSLRAGAEFAILLEKPAQAVKFTGIVNS